MVLADTLSPFIHRTQIVLGRGIPLFGGTAVPLERLGMVFGDTFSVVIHPT